ncbi:hypothetical protein [Pseudoalteromonas rubra]|uniref:hypothetical protein n=1 Tax=Pseudoalteromonas rubra TaxID=43658 RepID=UPI000F7B10E2|nr:hypothetical protein [Pseudoalteromonas rubra]
MRLFFVISIIYFFSAFYFVEPQFINYKYEAMKEAVNFFTASSGAVFTLLGLWVAYVYPNAIVKIVRPSVDDIFSKDDLVRLRRMLFVLCLCIMIIAASLFFHVLYLFLYGTEYYNINSYFIKKLALILIGYLSIVQFIVFYFVVATNVNFLNDLYTKRNMQEVNDKLSK